MQPKPDKILATGVARVCLRKAGTALALRIWTSQAPTCEMCQHQIIRYVHHMRHSEYPVELSCGCYCAGRMEMDYAAARKRERALRNAGRRRANWLRRS